MPALPLGAIIAGGATLGSGIWSSASQGRMNQQSRSWNEMMWQKQNMQNYANWLLQNQYNENMWNKEKDYMEGLWNKQNQYNEDMWHTQNKYNEQITADNRRYNEMIWQRENEYNSPAAQMARFKEAGLNPNLIYGQSNMGGSISNATLEPVGYGQSSPGSANAPRAGAPNAAGVMPWNPKPANFDLENGLLTFNKFREQSVRTNNLEQQNELIRQDAALRAIDVARADIGKEVDGLNRDKVRELQAEAIQSARDSFEGVRRDNAIKKRQEEILTKDAFTYGSRFEQSQKESKARVKNLDMDTLLKEYERELNKSGVSSKDELPWRMMAFILSKLGYSLGDLISK